MTQNKNPLVQNLLDAGADPKAAARFSSLLQNSTQAQQMRFLREQRAILLDSLHESQRHLDCLDHLIYNIQKG